MWISARYRDFASHADSITNVRCGQIVTSAGRWIELQAHRLRFPPSLAQVWWVTSLGRGVGDECRLHYHVPRSVPDYLTLDFIRSGLGTSYRTLIAACHILDQVARLRRSAAIVTHVTNPELSDRFLQRLGWERHCTHWRGRHFIRRFDSGYPELQKSFF